MEDHTFSKNFIIATLASSLSASAALVPVLSSIAAAYPEWEAWVQLLVTIPPLFIMVSSMAVSPLLRIFSEKIIALLGLVLVLFSGVYPWFSDSFILLLLSRVVMGLGLGLVTTISSSLPATFFSHGDDRDKATGIQSAFSSFGGVAFSYLSGWIAANFFWKDVFLVQLLNIIPLFAVFFFMPQKEKKQKTTSSISSVFFAKDALFLVILAFLCISFTVTFPLNMSLFINKYNIGTTNLSGIISSINSFIGFIIGLSFFKITNIFKEKTLPLALLIVSISFFIISQAREATMFLLGSTLFGVGTSIIYPAFLTIIYADIRADSIVSAIAMYTVATNVAQFVSPFVINPMANILGDGIEKRFVLAGSLLVLLSVVFFVYSKTKKNRSIL